MKIQKIFAICATLSFFADANSMKAKKSDTYILQQRLCELQKENSTLRERLNLLIEHLQKQAQQEIEHLNKIAEDLGDLTEK